MTQTFNIIAEQSECTVMAHYDAVPRNAEAYQSESELERSLIKQLTDQGYEYARITNEAALIENLRRQLEALNGYKFSDGEWNAFFKECIAADTMGIEEKTALIQQGDTVINIKRDNGETKNIKLIDKKSLANNKLQVINQYVPEGGSSKNRYDVTLLVNGLPLVHIELKRRGVSIKEAFNQINRYIRETFWAGKALFEYAQIFIISNGTQTKYYSNTTRMAREKESGDTSKKPGKKLDSNSFEFTSYWSDAQNNVICDLEDFARTFLRKMPLLNVLTKYCVFTADRLLMVMRPYQIAATERILQRIDIAVKNKRQGKVEAGGYIWHTTGSGKTLTSFKTAQLAMQIPEVHKVLFVVDRQDLDYQTMKEYDNFCPDCANGSTNSAILERQLKAGKDKILITTIQKLSHVLKKKSDGLAEVMKQNVVFIFDECHRSQFGSMHAIITKKFKRYIMFGFTGTPIFAANAVKSAKNAMTTTEQAFGEKLHSYTIIDAIRDNNVLKFRVDYVSTMKNKGTAKEEQVRGIDTKEALASPQRISQVAGYILDHYDQKTKRASSDSYVMKQLKNVEAVVLKGKNAKEERQNVKTRGFNALFAVESVDMARKYYMEFLGKMESEDAKRLTIATIFTHEANEEEDDNGIIETDPAAIEDLEPTSKEFLKNIALPRYNAQFGTSYTVDGESFQNYYKDISLRMKNKEIDLLIVVGMFLTGFDAKTLNTLFVDKNLKMHGLLQAYSRTNRILNAVKDCGQIVCFRNLEQATNECFALFGNKDAKGIVLMLTFADYYNGYTDDGGKYHEGYKDIVALLLEKFPVESLKDICDMGEKKEFIRLFGNYLRAFNLLTSFDDFCPNTIDALNAVRIITEGTRQDYLSWYNDLYDEYRKHLDGQKSGEIASILDDVEFEMDLVKQVQIDITYILALIEQYRQANCNDAVILLKIRKSMDASPDMRDKRDLVERFIARLTPDSGEVYGQWDEFLKQECEAEISAIIADERLKDKETRAFMAKCFKEGYVETLGGDITKLLPPMPIFGGGGEKRAETKARVVERLRAFFERFFSIARFSDEDESEKNTEKVRLYSQTDDSQLSIAAEYEEKYKEPSRK